MISQTSHRSNGFFIFLSGFFLMTLAVSVFTSLYWLVAIPFVVLFFYLGWQHRQFIFFALIFCLPWSVEYNFNSSLATDLPDEPLMLLTAALFIAYVFFNPSEVVRAWKHPLIILTALYFTWIIITVIFSTNGLVSAKFILAKSWYLIAFVLTPLLVFKNRRSIVTTCLVLLISMLLIVILSLYRHSFSGFRFAEINNAVHPFFRNHVNYSAMLVCTIPLLIATYQLNKKYRLAIVTALILVSVALLFSYARGAWLALFAGLLSYWLIRKGKLLVAFVISVVLIIASLCWVKANDRYLQYAHDYRTTIFHQNFEEHLIATYKLKDVSTAERFNRWIAGLRMIKDNWLTGYGPNTFYYNYKPYTIPAFKTWVSDNKDHSTVHNYFLLTIIEQGVPGFLLLLLLIGAMLYYAEKIYSRVQHKFYKTIAMTCGVILVMILVVNFLSDLIETDKVGSLFFLCLSTLVAIDFNTRNKDGNVAG